jgi:DNA topoisomerase I
LPRLRRADPGGPGLTRRRRGGGFTLLDAGGEPVTDPAALERVNALAIPPAWKDVWICEDPLGHVQAVGTDDAGRRQYLYHPQWHAQRARRKFADMEAFAAALPALREHVERDLAREGLPADRVLACTVRLLDRGFFRIGCEDYAERNGTYGLATMRKEHVEVVDDGGIVFDFPAKHGVRRVQHVVDEQSAEIVRALKRRRGGGPELFASREGPRGPWRDVRSGDINAYLKRATGLEVSAKDFRTWNATVLAAVAIAVADPKAQTTARRKAPSVTARRRAVTRAVKEVARYLGNTPAVARNSYIDPRVFDRFMAGATIGPALGPALREADPGEPATQGPIEAAVLELLGSGSVAAG